MRHGVSRQRRNQIGKLVRGHRERQAFSRTDLSILSGISPRAIAGIELGENAPTIGTLDALAKALGVKARDLI